MALWGVLGIVFALCCWPLGVVFAILSLRDARKVGRQPTLAFVALCLVVLSVIITIILAVTGALGNMLSGSYKFSV
jgi:hypothetical protein